jgi:hypothetical protein
VRVRADVTDPVEPVATGRVAARTWSRRTPGSTRSYGRRASPESEERRVRWRRRGRVRQPTARDWPQSRAASCRGVPLRQRRQLLGWSVVRPRRMLQYLPPDEPLVAPAQLRDPAAVLHSPTDHPGPVAFDLADSAGPERPSSLHSPHHTVSSRTWPFTARPSATAAGKPDEPARPGSRRRSD